MDSFDRNTRFTFVPSVEDVSSYTGDNLYYCGLEIVHESVCALIEEAKTEFFRDHEGTTDPHFANPRFGQVENRESKGYAGSFPELTFDVVMMVLSSGMGIGVYRLLSLWIKAKNGRKIHVKLPNGLVVDATQMSHEEFSAFLEEIYAVYERLEGAKRLEKHVKQKRLPVVSKDADFKARQELTEAVREKQDEIFRRLKREERDLPKDR